MTDQEAPTHAPVSLVVIVVGGLLMTASMFFECVDRAGYPGLSTFDVLGESFYPLAWPTWLEAWPIGFGLLTALFALASLSRPGPRTWQWEWLTLSGYLGLTIILGPRRFLVAWWWYWSQGKLPLWDSLFHVGSASLVLAVLILTSVVKFDVERRAHVARLVGAMLVLAYLIPVTNWTTEAVLWTDGPGYWMLHLGSLLVAATSTWRLFRQSRCVIPL